MRHDASQCHPDFTDKTSGLFNDTFSTTDMLNAGNRGCNACHEDLWDVMNMKDGYKHILTHVGYDKALTYQDCEPCHRGHTALTGPYLGDLIHAAHYGSKVFQEANGNCWSCHAMNSAGGQGDYQLVLWDDFYDEPALSGYPNIDGNEMEQRLGRLPRLLRRICERHDPGRGARHRCQAFDQAVTDHDDVFIVNNWGPEVTEKNGEPFSFDAVCSEENTVCHHRREEPPLVHEGRTSCHAPDRVHHGASPAPPTAAAARSCPTSPCPVCRWPTSSSSAEAWPTA